MNAKAVDEMNRAEGFRFSLDLEVTQLLEAHKMHELTPEDHPMYGTEWKKFWQKRYEELKEEGKVKISSYDSY